MAGGESAQETKPPSRATDPLAAETLEASAPAGGTDAFPVPGWDRYEPLGLLGHGGMGVVFRARDRRLGRDVALKFIRGLDPDLTMRFVKEARAQARIDHPNVCQIFEAGEVSGRAYIAMALVVGERLDRVAASLTLPEKVQVMRDVALAMHEAHKLGIVHRDLKPGNIMIERRDDGRPFPVVMDFGLAAELGGDLGLTRTGAVIGTPAYMSPEQARGEVRLIDRRSDVYSLGATLYELLAGKPPFLAASVADLMGRVLHDDPPSLRARVPELPRDLETIALKCLRKEMSARYDSARALAEDLQRTIDGDPILGARASLAERVLRFARRHRALVAVSAVSFVLVVVAAAAGIRARLQAEERARLAETLGQDVKEIEWFWRLASTLPRHDTTPEKQLIHRRMVRFAAHREDGAVHHALGRAHLALHELEPARAELERARAMGVDRPELWLARGRVLGELYHRAVEDARRSGDPEWAAAQEKRLAAELLAPAVASLERSRGVELESPHYLEGLLALYRRDPAGALRAADDAIAEAPWLAEVHQLGGDAIAADAQERLDRGDYDHARAAFADAARRYQRAVDVGRSDPALLEALSQAWFQLGEVDTRRGAPPREALEHALAAAEDATQVAPDRASAFRQAAFALMRLYQYRSDSEARAMLTRWSAAAARAVELDPGDVAAHDALGNARYQEGMLAYRDGGDPAPALDAAARSFERAIALRPAYPWALNDLGYLHQRRAFIARLSGKDPLPEAIAAVASFERAVRADPRYLFAWANLMEIHAFLAEEDLLHGRDPDAHVRAAAAAGASCLAVDPHYHGALNLLAQADLIEAEYLEKTGGAAAPLVDRALAELDRALAVNASDQPTLLTRAVAYHRRASLEAGAGRDPSAAIAAGRAALAAAGGRCRSCKVLGAKLALIEGTPSALQAALTDLASVDREDAEVLETRALVRARLDELRKRDR